MYARILAPHTADDCRLASKDANFGDRIDFECWAREHPPLILAERQAVASNRAGLCDAAFFSVRGSFFIGPRSHKLHYSDWPALQRSITFFGRQSSKQPTTAGSEGRNGGPVEAWYDRAPSHCASFGSM
jgi:hypothetical protein